MNISPEFVNLAKFDDKKFESLLTKYLPLIESVKWKYRINGYDDSDLTQIARISVWKAVKSFDGDEAGLLSGLVRQIVKRDITELIRYTNCQKRKSEEVEFDEKDFPVSDDLDFLVGMIRVFRGVHAEIFRLIQSGYNQTEIADILGHSRTTVQRHFRKMKTIVLTA